METDGKSGKNEKLLLPSDNISSVSSSSSLSALSYNSDKDLEDHHRKSFEKSMNELSKKSY